MVDVAINIDLEQTGAVAGKPTNRVYPQEVHDIFAGQQLTLAGRYNASGAARIIIAGKVNGDERTFTFPASFAAQSDSQSYAFVEKIWASRRIGQIIDQLDLEGQNEELVNELVELSVKHGILTPYTSFLADDQARPAELADDRFGRQRAESLVSRLGEAEGAGGFRQRESKRRFQVADRLPSAQSFSASRVDGPAAPAGVLITSIDSDEVLATNAVLQVGNETLFRRGRLLIAANAREVDLEQEGDQIVNVARYSDAYFRLVAANRPAENAVLARQAVDEELIVRLRGQVYRIQ
jgi:Ca-activated chloride channel family protein